MVIINLRRFCAGRYSYFTYGRYEGAHGGYIPPSGLAARVLYWLGNLAGRRFGPPTL